MENVKLTEHYELMKEKIALWLNDLQQAGLPNPKLKMPTDDEVPPKILDSILHWFERFRKAVAEQRIHRRRLPESTWIMYQLSGADDNFEEVKVMRRKWAATRQVWGERPGTLKGQSYVKKRPSAKCKGNARKSRPAS